MLLLVANGNKEFCLRTLFIHYRVRVFCGQIENVQLVFVGPIESKSKELLHILVELGLVIGHERTYVPID